MTRWTLRMPRNDAEMTAVRMEADADDADLAGKRMEASKNYREWKKCTCRRSLITADGGVITAHEPLIAANGKKSA